MQLLLSSTVCPYVARLVSAVYLFTYTYSIYRHTQCIYVYAYRPKRTYIYVAIAFFQSLPNSRCPIGVCSVLICMYVYSVYIYLYTPRRTRTHVATAFFDINLEDTYMYIYRDYFFRQFVLTLMDSCLQCVYIHVYIVYMYICTDLREHIYVQLP